MAIFGPKPWVDPFGKMSICRLFELLFFYMLERRFFALEYRKSHFPGLYGLKKKGWKTGHFWTKTMGSPLWKKSRFFDCWTFCFYRLERLFLVLENRKRHFAGLYSLIKRRKNGHFWTKTMGSPLWKNIYFSTFWTSCFYSLERRFFVVKYRKRNFLGLYCIKEKLGKMAIFGSKLSVNPLEKLSLFRLFELLFL